IREDLNEFIRLDLPESFKIKKEKILKIIIITVNPGQEKIPGKKITVTLLRYSAFPLHPN
ncbi:hypothetical protein ACTJJ0_25325, partial [Chitinophaga sp. 22321]|uniref:hypothetical protein n=1 Tax=Chitinophaga sp. 22321 TaxID=3453909 RepID=UPI003F84DD4A